MSKAKTERGVEHATVVVERFLDATPAKVFAAFADLKNRRQWDVPGEDWIVAEFKQDFRVGGEETERFGPKDHPNLHSHGRFLDIVPDVRIVSAGTMHQDDVRLSSTLFTAEFYAEGSGTRFFLTDQSVFYKAGETPADRKGGWDDIVDRLEAFLKK